MIKGLILGLTLSILSFLGCAGDTTSEARISHPVAVQELSLIDQVAKTTYKVSCDSSTGSAVAIGPNTLITAAHVVYERPSIVKREKILIYNSLTNYISSVEIGRVDLQGDLAILTPATPVPHWARVYTFPERLVWGSEVLAVGHPLGVDFPVATSGRIVNIKENVGERPVKLLHSATTYFGNSGGPLFIKTGNSYLVIGIAHMVYAEYPVLSLATEPEAFLKFVFNVGDKK